jgi:hypothetical protein
MERSLIFDVGIVEQFRLSAEGFSVCPKMAEPARLGVLLA